MKSKLFLKYEIYKILHKYSDDNHSLSLNEIQNYLRESGFEKNDETVKRAILSLKNDFDVDIITTVGRNAGYHIGNRYFELTELKLLIDAVHAANFVGKHNVERICGKLKNLTSIYENEKLERQVLGISVAKRDNEKIMYVVDSLWKAMNGNWQVEFDYLAWSPEKQLIKKRNKRYKVSPWALIWANDRYYLYGYRRRDGEKLVESNFRVDKIDNLDIVERKREGQQLFKNFDATSYVSKRLGMFSGSECTITVRASAELVGAFIDQFGKQIVIQKCNEEECDDVLITFVAVNSPNLLGWLIGLQSVHILEPSALKKDMYELLKRNIVYYSDEQ